MKINLLFVETLSLSLSLLYVPMATQSHRKRKPPLIPNFSSPSKLGPNNWYQHKSTTCGGVWSAMCQPLNELVEAMQ